MENNSKYTNFQSASGKHVIVGPGLSIGYVQVGEQELANRICESLEQAFNAGRSSKAMEIKRALDDKT